MCVRPEFNKSLLQSYVVVFYRWKLSCRHVPRISADCGESGNKTAQLRIAIRFQKTFTHEVYLVNYFTEHRTIIFCYNFLRQATSHLYELFSTPKTLKFGIPIFGRLSGTFEPWTSGSSKIFADRPPPSINLESSKQ